MSVSPGSSETRRGDRRAVRRVARSLVSALVVACQSQAVLKSPRAPESYALPWVLHANPAKSTPVRRDVVEIEHQLWNFGSPTEISNHPARYEYVVIDQSDSVIAAQGEGFEPMMFGHRVNVVVPRNGLIGERVNLAGCGSGSSLLPLDQSACLRWYRFEEGEYRVVVKYRFRASENAAERSSESVVMSDTVRIRVRND